MHPGKLVVALLLGALAGGAAAQSVLPPTANEPRDTFGTRGPGSVAPILDLQIDRGVSLPKGVEEQREFAAEPPPPPPMPAEKPQALPRKPEPKR